MAKSLTYVKEYLHILIIVLPANAVNLQVNNLTFYSIVLIMQVIIRNVKSSVSQSFVVVKLSPTEISLS